jgi:hypothetical protein
MPPFTVKAQARTAEHRAMAPRNCLAIGALACLAACARDAGAADAVLATFARFQDALFAGDVAALRALVTAESAPAVDAIPFDRVREQQPLQALCATDERGSWFVHVHDPNAGRSGCESADGVYVVVRENGRLVVDLIATAAMHSTPTGPGRSEVVPRELTPEDLEQIRRRELAAPPVAPPR